MPAESRAGALAALGGIVALAIAWYAEHRLSMAPCALCLMERWPYRVLALLGVATVLAPARLARILVPLLALPLLASIALALTHVGVEQAWWPDPVPQCMAPTLLKGSMVHGGSMAERLASMPLRPAKPCDAPNRLIDWLPVSMATLDLIYAATMSVVVAATAWRPARRPA
ncbi:disulfide bond formation protein B [Lichenicoccus sp.]|uniref:disulfide bond formation protein B n=1 Tax=Lichenicoccus sp. TaxID=2781899 RepID=UPI003D0F602F